MAYFDNIPQCQDVRYHSRLDERQSTVSQQSSRISQIHYPGDHCGFNENVNHQVYSHQINHNNRQMNHRNFRRSDYRNHQCRHRDSSNESTRYRSRNTHQINQNRQRKRRRRLSPPPTPPSHSPDSSETVVVSSDNDNDKNIKKQPIKSTNHQMKDTIISIEKGSFTIHKKMPRNPVFYDLQSDLAQKCKEIEYLFDGAPFEEDEKRRLVIHEQLNVIRKHRLFHEQCVDDYGNPLSPSGSEQEENEEEDPNRVEWGEMKNTDRRHIWEDTREIAVVDQHGVNVLDNDGDEEMELSYWMYHPDHGYPIQATKPPADQYIDGNDILMMATTTRKKQKRKKQRKYKRNGKREKYGHYGEHRDDQCDDRRWMNEADRMELKANQLADYLDRIRMQTMNIN